MKNIVCLWGLIFVSFILTASPGDSADRGLPLVDGKEVVATVNQEPIFLGELNSAIAAAHSERTGSEKASRIDFSAIIERLISTKLIMLEAGNMGLYDLPEIKSQMADYSRDTLMEQLLAGYVKDIKADDREIDRLYKEAVREWEIKSIKFEKEDNAKQFEEDVRKGQNFDNLAKKAIQAKIAQGDEESIFVKHKDLTLPVAQLISEMQIGAVSPIVSLDQNGFLLFKLEGSRYPQQEEDAARKRAAQQALNNQRVKAVKSYVADLKKKYVNTNEKLLETLDFEAKAPGFEKLLKDKRTIAKIKGEKPITVAEFAKALQDKFYHGIKQAIEAKQVNERKANVLEEMIQKRILPKEAFKKKLDKTSQFKDRMKNYETSLVFGAFVQKVVMPEIKMTQGELKEYYDNNHEEFTPPQMMRIKSLVFGKKSSAQDAITKLMKGTDFAWLGSHGEGLLDNSAPGVLNFDGKLLTVRSLPEEAQRAVSGAKPGDFRLYEDATANRFYVLYIYNVAAPEPQPLESVRKEIAEKIIKRKVKISVEDWASKLRAFYPVTIYLPALQP